MGYTYLESCLVYGVNLGSTEQFIDLVKNLPKPQVNSDTDTDSEHYSDNENDNENDNEYYMEKMDDFLYENGYGSFEVLNYGFGGDAYFLFYNKSKITGGLEWEDEEINVSKMLEVENSQKEHFVKCLNFLKINHEPKWKNVLRIF